MSAHRRSVPPPPLVLVVDDNFESRLVAEGYLSGAGYGVELAVNGEDALDAMQDRPPDLVLLDVRLPDVSGVEVCRRIRADRASDELPVLFVTSVTDPDVQRDALDAGADDYLTKPLRRVELLMRVRSLLRLRRLAEERRSANGLIEEQRDRLLDMVAHRRRLVSMVVHDLKGPLSGVQGGLRQLLRNPDLSDPALEALRDLSEASDWMQHMVQEMLDLSRAEDIGLGAEPTWISVCPLAETAVASLRRQAAELDRDLVLRCEPADSLVFADAGLLRRVIVNLVDNAIRHTRRGTAVEVDLFVEESALVVLVRDRGPGIPEGDRAALFELYGQIDGRHGGTSGLGLAFCRLAAEAHGGTIGVEARDGGGASFRVTLPQPQPG